MFWTLTKKQFRECFRGYFIDPKNGKARSKIGRLGMFVLFAVLMVTLSGAFVGMCAMLSALLQTPFPWLYYALLSVSAVMLGTFGSVFSTYSILYLAKDNEQLMAMPIRPSVILGSRIMLVYGMSLIYSSVMWIPAVVYSWFAADLSAAAILFQCILGPVIAMIVSVITCALGWVVAVVSSRVKNRSFAVTAVSLVLVGGYFYASSQLSTFLTSLIANVAAVSRGIRTWGSLFYRIGSAATGDAMAMLLVCAVAIGIFAVCFWILSRSFVSIVTQSRGAEKKQGGVKISASGLQGALLKREWKRFLSSPTYMLNCGMGLVMLVAADVMVFLQRDTLLQAMSEISALMPTLGDFMPLEAVVAVCVICSMAYISAPSISLEGKNLWILRSLPVSGAEVLNAKLRLHLLLDLPVGILSAVVFGWGLKLNMEEMIVVMLYVAAFIWVHGSVGLVLGLHRPNFTWTSETMPIKQSIHVFLTLLAGILIVLITVAACFLLRDYVKPIESLTGAAVLLAFAAANLHRWLNNTGGRKFEAL